MTASLHNSEITRLGQCNLNTHIIAIDTHADEGSKIVTLAKSDITCWQLFLRLFNAGSLARYQIHLNDVATYLSQYEWSVLGMAKNTETHLAYRRVCELANKGLSLKYNQTLFNRVALSSAQKQIELEQFCDGRSINRLVVNQTIHWNPFMQTQHLAALLRNRYAHSTIRIEDQNLQPYISGAILTLDALHQARITIGQTMLTRIEYVPVMVPAPQPRPQQKPPVK